MPFRTAILASSNLALALAPVPALASDDSAMAAKAGEIAAKLNDPLTQYAIAGMLSAMTKALLDMPVAPMVDAVEQASGKRVGNLPRDARVADLAGTDQAEVREKIVDTVPRAMSAMGALAGTLEAMAPQLEEMTRTMRDSLPQR